MCTDNPFKGALPRILSGVCFKPCVQRANMQNIPRSNCPLCEAGVPLKQQHIIIEVNHDGVHNTFSMTDELMDQVQRQIEAHFDNHITILKNLPK